eukprot:2654129-Ditylum_brightwellii.AAC.1
MVMVFMRPWYPVGATKGKEAVLGGWGGGDGAEMHILAPRILWLTTTTTTTTMMQIPQMAPAMVPMCCFTIATHPLVSNTNKRCIFGVKDGTLP